jgi:hypothetical protein
VNEVKNQKKKTGARMQENIRRLCGSSVGGEGGGKVQVGVYWTLF